MKVKFSFTVVQATSSLGWDSFVGTLAAPSETLRSGFDSVGGIP